MFVPSYLLVWLAAAACWSFAAIPVTQAFGLLEGQPLPTTTTTASTPSTRRNVIEKTAAASVFLGMATVLPYSSPAAAAGLSSACPAGSKNCIVTTWIPPTNLASSSTNKIAQAMVQILESYPQQGQADVDKGGWKFLANNDDNNNVISVEYKSGIGNFAKFFNGGQPFVDDLVAVVGKKDDATTAVTIRSSSRVGDSDMGVNQKRLQFLAAQARSQGWQVPEPKY